MTLEMYHCMLNGFVPILEDLRTDYVGLQTTADTALEDPAFSYICFIPFAFAPHRSSPIRQTSSILTKQ